MKALLAFSAISLLSVTSYAECAPEVTLRSVAVAYERSPGVWFHVEVARCLRDEITFSRNHIGLLEESLRLRNEEAVTLRKQVGQYKLSLAQLEEAQSLTNEVAQDLTKQASKQKRTGLKWGLVGFLSGLAAAVTGAVIVGATK